MKILITGANGYLGANLVRHFAQTGAQVYGVVRQVPSDRPLGSDCPTQSHHPGGSVWTEQFQDLIVGDLRAESTLAAIARWGLDHVVHTVSLDHRLSQTAAASQVLGVNVEPTLALLQTLTGQGLERFIYFSTQQVYGRLEPRAIAEDYPTQPLNRYGLTHLLCEQIVDQFHRTSDTACLNLRLSNGTGAPVFLENNCWWLVINDFCQTAHRQGRLQILSDGSPQRDFIAIADIVQAVEHLLTLPFNYLKPGPSSEAANSPPIRPNTFNLGSGHTQTIAEVAQLVAEIYRDRTGQALPIVNAAGAAFTPSPGHSPRFAYQTQALQALGFTCQQTLATTIHEIFDFLAQADPQN